MEDRADVDVPVEEDDRVDDADEEVRDEDDLRLDDDADCDPLDDAVERPLSVVEAVERDAVCQRFPPDPDDGRVIPAVGRPSSRFET